MSKTHTRATAIATALGAGALLALTPAVAAHAHVTASATSTVAGAHSVITFSVPHGCDGSPTLVLEIEIPEQIISVTPTVNPNWTITKNMVPLDAPQQDSHGADITERVGSVTYTAVGDGLPEGYRDTVSLSLQLPQGEPGDRVEFPTLQSCLEGSVEWVGDEAPAITLSDDAPLSGQAPGGEAGDDDPQAREGEGDTDVLARVIGIAGLAFGAVGVVLAIAAGRSRPEGAKS